MTFPFGNQCLVQLGTYMYGLTMGGGSMSCYQKVPGMGDWYAAGGVVGTNLSSPGCLLASSYVHLEALAPEGNNLFHFWFSPATGLWTQTEEPVSQNATGSACLIQSSYRGNASSPGNFEALVLEGSNLVHYWKDNSKNNSPWSPGAVVSAEATGPACLIQSTFKGSPAAPGNFEALVLESTNLVHYWRDNSDPAIPWHRGAVVTTTATGPASFIESTYQLDPSVGGRNFEALVLNDYKFQHYWRDNADGVNWHPGVYLPMPPENIYPAGTCSLIQVTQSEVPGKPGDFEVLLAIAPWNSETYDLWEYRRDNSDLAMPWESVEQFPFP